MVIPGKVVLITGASRGIGAACAHALSRRSAQLSLTARNPSHHPGALVTTGDITSPDVRARLVDATLQRFGRIDVLINNAGQGNYHSVVSTSAADARSVFDLNFFAPLALAQLVIPHMRENGGGTLVNISSIAAQIAVPWMPLYSAAKSALASLTDALRCELNDGHIRAMTVYPGYVDTPFHAAAVGSPPTAIARAKRFAISPAHCAESIARGLERDARTVVTPGAGWLLVWLQRIFPTLVDSRLSALAK